jgi:hypothetical protein
MAVSSKRTIFITDQTPYPSFGIFCGTLVYFVVLWYILWYYGKFCGTLVYFTRFAMLYQEKCDNPGCESNEFAQVLLTRICLNATFIIL